MLRFTKAFALAAVTTAGLLFTTLAPASAATSLVEFRVQNVDPTNSMKLTATPSSAFSGYLPVGTEIKPGGYDPSASGFITYAGALPTHSGQPVVDHITYGDYTSGGLTCAFAITVAKVTGGYQLSFSVDTPSRCSVPSATPTSATGDFSATIYGFSWHE